MAVYYRYMTLDVFTPRAFGGNPLAVFPRADGLSTERMQLIAREMNLSETAFVFFRENDQQTFRLRIFTPTMELPFAGHPTIGAAWVLVSKEELPVAGEKLEIIFGEGVGNVPVTIALAGKKPLKATLTAAQLPEFGPAPPPPDAIAAMLSLETGDLLDDDGHHPQAVSCGVPFLIVPLRNREAMTRATINMQLWRETLAEYWEPSVYLISFDPQYSRSDVRARMFAPAHGVVEDPATGGAAAALAGYLGSRHEQTTGSISWHIEQGLDMGRPSFLDIDVDKHNGAMTAVRVSGMAVMIGEGTMQVPE